MRAVIQKVTHAKVDIIQADHSETSGQIATASWFY